MERWFTADTHFGQEKLLQLQPRPYSSLAEMEEDLIRRWNEVVKPGDIVYHLGDFAVGKAEDKPRLQVIFNRLNGEKMLVSGNHDNRNAFIKKLGWKWVGDIKNISVDGIDVVLFHWPMQAWDGSMTGSWHLYGHVHGMLPEHRATLKMDVGVDVPFYGELPRRPFSFGEVKEVMSHREFVPPDKRQVYYKEDFPEGFKL